MLSQIQKLFFAKAKRRRVHRAPSATSRNGHFERLESRAMLSASTGVPQFAINEYGRQMHGHAESPPGDAAIVAPPPRSATVDGGMQPYLGPVYSHANILNQSPAFSSLGDGPDAWSHGSALSVSIYVQPAWHASSLTNPVATAAAAPATTIYFIFVKTSPSNFDNAATSTTSPPPPQIARATSPTPASAAQAPKPAGDRLVNSPVFATSAMPANSSPLTASATFATPNAAQTLARESDRSSFVSTNAANAIFQAYSPHLLLMASSVNSARSGAQSVADDGAMSDEAFDGFIHLRDLSPVHDAYAPSDVAARELAAVDAILESLQDLEPLPTGFDQPTARDDARGMVGVSALGTPLPLVLAKLALAEAQGGMVMLELNEANSGDIDFSNIAESNATLPAFRSGVEAVVGFYQTVDVGGGEPAAETHPVGNASPNPTRQTQPANQYSNDEGSGTSRKSAAAIGISMLVGAMLWVAQRQQNGDNNAESESTKGERGKV